MTRLSHLVTSVLLPAAAKAHFSILYPEPLAADQGDQNAGPCGGYDPDFSSHAVTDFHVGGDAIALQNTHPQANWLLRGTLDQTAQGNWTQLFPIVQQSGQNKFCEPAVTAPEEWIGERGVLGVVANAPDGLLYACALVSFVEGVGETPEQCTNTSTVEVAFVDDEEFSAMVGESSSSSTEDSSPPDAEEPDGDSGAGLVTPTLGGLVYTLLMGIVFLI